MFFGEYEHNLDDKGRVTVPSGFRDELAGGVFVTRGPEGCLLVFRLDAWVELSRKFKRGSISRHIARVLYAGSEAQLDRHGRILIPAPLREYAGLESGESATVVGVDDRLELWSKDRWREVTRSAVEDGQFIEELAELGL
jgi:MraZ protein